MKEEDYLNPKQYYLKLKLERLKAYIKMIVFLEIIISSIWLISVCITGYDISDKLNVCLQEHSLDYCNTNIK